MFTRQLACLAFLSLLVAPVALAQTPVALELGKSVSAELAGGQTPVHGVGQGGTVPARERAPTRDAYGIALA